MPMPYVGSQGTVVTAAVGSRVVGITVVGITVVGSRVFGITVIGSRVVGITVVGSRVVGITVVGSRVVGTVTSSSCVFAKCSWSKYTERRARLEFGVWFLYKHISFISNIRSSSWLMKTSLKFKWI